MALEPEILRHPKIPLALHGINPRSVYGKAWWDKHRQICYKQADYKCQACGIPKADTPQKWLEAHEVYDFDFHRQTLTFKRLVCLCHNCHAYIHQGKLNIDLQNKVISRIQFNRIINHGHDILRSNNLLPSSTKTDLRFTNWRMMIDNTPYGPSSDSLDDWKAGQWRSWKPQSTSFDFNSKSLAHQKKRGK